jgi:hypothetical protein
VSGLHDFSQRPLIAGSFIGIRSWRVTDEGVLTGVHAQEPWTVSENAAQCVTPGGTFGAAYRALADAVAGAGIATAELAWTVGKMTAAANGQVYLRKRPPKPKPRPRSVPLAHPAGTLSCQCGFYAYFDLAHNPHHLASNVLGLIEGYGTMTIGERGFRASKAHIVALIEPVPATVREAYEVLPPIFSTIEAALAEFPLSTPPAPDPTRRQKRSPGGVQPPPQTPRDRALQLRQGRNTGPAHSRGLDGHYRPA